MLATRTEWITDPRPDLADDSVAWEYILASAYDAETQPHALFGCLHGVRCLGARLQVADGSLRIIPPDGEEPSYQEARAVFMEHHRRLQIWLAKGSTMR